MLFFITFLALLLLVLLILVTNCKQVANSVKVLLQNESYALSCQRVTGEITVIGLIVYPNSRIAIRSQKVTQVEVANEG